MEEPKPAYEPNHSHEPGWKPLEEWPLLDLKMMGKVKLPKKRLHDIKEQYGLSSYFEKPTQRKGYPERVNSGKATIGYLYTDLTGKFWLQRKCQTDRRCNYIMRELVLPDQERTMRLQGDIEFLD